MIRSFLATTAIAMLLTGNVYAAQDNTHAAAPAPNGQTQPVNPPGMKSAKDVKADEAEQSGGHLASQLIGKSVYNGAGNDAQNIGDVNDLVLGKDGKVASVVVGVGGFLGMGQKNVAIDYGQVEWQQRNGAWTIVVPTTADELKALPDFDRSAFNAAPSTTVANSGAGTGAPAPTAPAGGMATADKGAPTTTPNATGQTAGADRNATDTSKTAAIDRNKLDKLDVGKISASDLIGTTVYGADDANVGSINDVVLDKSGKIDAIVVNVGGFLGVGSKQVAVGMDNLAFLTDNNGRKYLYTEFTKDELSKQPAYDKATYAENRDKMRMIVK